jgi:hypothetical protein
MKPRCPLLALNGQFTRAGVCPLLDQSGQSRILARDGLSAFDPKRTFFAPPTQCLEPRVKTRSGFLPCTLPVDSPGVLTKIENAVKVELVGEFVLKGIRRPLAA